MLKTTPNQPNDIPKDLEECLRCCGNHDLDMTNIAMVVAISLSYITFYQLHNILSDRRHFSPLGCQESPSSLLTRRHKLSLSSCD